MTTASITVMAGNPPLRTPHAFAHPPNVHDDIDAKGQGLVTKRTCAALLALGLFGLAIPGCSSDPRDHYHDYHSGRYSARGVYYEDQDEYVSRRREWARNYYFDQEFQPWGQSDRPHNWSDEYYDWAHQR